MCAERSLPWPGSPHPLGATYDPINGGTNFALWSPGAESVTLCLLDADGGESDRLELAECTAAVWHGFVPGPGPGDRYGYRVAGPWDPAHGARFNPAKLLVDPYARAITGDWDADPVTYGHTYGGSDLMADPRDSAGRVPMAVIVGDDPARFGSPQLEPAPQRAWADTVLYELHVRGFTQRHPEVPPEHRGTYAGLAHPAVTGYLTDLGVTAVELLPVHHFLSEEHLLRGGRRNYWGYNTIGWFAPHAGFSASGSTGGQVHEFREMVRALHTAGLEVILDVVFNHSAEGDETGPTLSLRGIDNRAYYRLSGGGRRYDDTTGCGNTLDVRSPQVVALIADSLRYWVTELGVDGFRFDLAPALLRGDWTPDARPGLLTVLAQDPVLSRVKLIAEPWDLGAGGYLLGGFPAPWAEWNDRFRGDVRDFWRRSPVGVDDLAWRLAGSSDVFNRPGRSPQASVNYVTAHDGFTMHDLVTYSVKHNEDNGEDNRDGTDDNRSWNCGDEGESNDLGVIALRERQIRNLLLTLILSAGVPMLVAGDEGGRTQSGNNNAYCLDDATTWVDWTPTSVGARLHAFTRGLLNLRAQHPVFRQERFFSGGPLGADGRPDVAWFRADGAELTDGDWHNTAQTTLGMLLNGDALTRRGPRGETVHDDSFLLLVHAGPFPVEFHLPRLDWAAAYLTVLATEVKPPGGPTTPPRQPGAIVAMPPNSAVLLRVEGFVGPTAKTRW